MVVLTSAFSYEASVPGINLWQTKNCIQGESHDAQTVKTDEAKTLYGMHYEK